jgi:thiol-disulfide isomerase/thioredoxin
VAIVSIAPVTDQVGGAVPSQSSGSPVGPTGGDNPQARAVSARTANTIVARRVAAIAARVASMRNRIARATLTAMRALACFALVLGIGCGASGDAKSSGTTLTERLAAANAARRPLVVEFGAAWCTPCHDFSEHVLTDARVQAALRDVAFVQYDIETASGAEAAKACDVTGVPAVIEIAPDGTPRPLTMGSEPTVEELVAFLEHAKLR